MAFSKEQKEAIHQVFGPVMVLAGPGSGKTTVLTQRILYMIKEHSIDPGKILVITFTHAASLEMKSRFMSLWEREGIRGDISASNITFGTFHSVFYSILRVRYNLKSENIITEKEKRGLLKALVERVSKKAVFDSDFYKELVQEIGKRKSSNNDTFNASNTSNASNASSTSNASRTSNASKDCILCEEEFEAVFNGYQNALKARKRFDFEDMISETYRLFNSEPETLRFWQNHYQFILVDEFQDVSPLQYKTLKLLAAPRNNLFIVGDDDQSIYGFRGAHPKIMLDFPKDYPTLKQILLSNNYRSKSEIVNFSSKIISKNLKRYPKAYHAANGRGGKIIKYNIPNTSKEYETVAALIQKEIQSGVNANEIGVLFRTNSLVRPLLSSMNKRQIPYTMKEKPSDPYQHFASKDLIAYIRLSTGKGSREDFLRIMNKPLRYISRQAVVGRNPSMEQLINYYKHSPGKQRIVLRLESLIRDLKSLSEMPTAQALIYIRKKIGYDVYLNEYMKEKRIDTSLVSNIISEITSEAISYPDKETWLKYTENYEEIVLNKTKGQGANSNRESAESVNGVRLMTYHGSKGLEFDIIHLIDAVEGITPYSKALSLEEIEEERRCFYVALTRARKEIHIYIPKNRSSKSCLPSRFLTDGCGR